MLLTLIRIIKQAILRLQNGEQQQSFYKVTTSFSIDIIEHACYFQTQNHKEHHISHLVTSNHTNDMIFNLILIDIGMRLGTRNLSIKGIALVSYVEFRR